MTYICLQNIYTGHHRNPGIDRSAMYARTFHKADQTRRFTITNAGGSGWDVREEQDDHVVRNVRYTDWHRVERAKMVFSEQARTLEESGWTETWAAPR